MPDMSHTPKRLAVCTSDWHMRETVPVNRKPGFSNQQLNKVDFILELCQKLDADLYNAGDIYNKARPPRWYTNRFQSLLASYPNVYHYACAGQHDQVYHSTNLADTSIQSLYSSRLIRHANSKRIRTVDWGGDIESPVDILIAHFCVTEKPIEFIPYSLTAEQFMTKVKARVIITGDYHVAHHLEREGQLLVNPGSIVRMGIDSIKRQPSVYVVDIGKAEVVDQVFLPSSPAEEVFDLKGAEKKKDQQKKKEQLAERFDKYLEQANNKQLKPDFDKNLTDVVLNGRPSEAVKTDIDTIMEEVR